MTRERQQHRLALLEKRGDSKRVQTQVTKVKKLEQAKKKKKYTKASDELLQRYHRHCKALTERRKRYGGHAELAHGAVVSMAQPVQTDGGTHRVSPTTWPRVFRKRGGAQRRLRQQVNTWCVLAGALLANVSIFYRLAQTLDLPEDERLPVPGEDEVTANVAYMAMNAVSYQSDQAGDAWAAVLADEDVPTQEQDGMVFREVDHGVVERAIGKLSNFIQCPRTQLQKLVDSVAGLGRYVREKTLLLCGCERLAAEHGLLPQSAWLLIAVQVRKGMEQLEAAASELSRQQSGVFLALAVRVRDVLRSKYDSTPPCPASSTLILQPLMDKLGEIRCAMDLLKAAFEGEDMAKLRAANKFDGRLRTLAATLEEYSKQTATGCATRY